MVYTTMSGAYYDEFNTDNTGRQFTWDYGI